MSGKIRYEEIANLLSTFQKLSEDCSIYNSEAKVAVGEFERSGLSIDRLEYTANLTNNMTNAADLLLQDYKRIIDFLQKVAEQARSAHDHAVSTLEATDSWKATETITRG